METDTYVGRIWIKIWQQGRQKQDFILGIQKPLQSFFSLTVGMHNLPSSLLSTQLWCSNTKCLIPVMGRQLHRTVVVKRRKWHILVLTFLFVFLQVVPLAPFFSAFSYGFYGSIPVEPLYFSHDCILTLTKSTRAATLEALQDEVSRSLGSKPSTTAFHYVTLGKLLNLFEPHFPEWLPGKQPMK